MNTHLFDHLARRFASLALVALALASLPAHAQRVALLVGNANYSVGRLTNPPNDVAAMEAALNKLGFKVQKVLNANQNQLKRAVRDFGTAAQGAEVAFMYYSGHGIQAQGENYLLPIGAAIDKESDYGIEAVSANEVLRQIQGARPQAAILVLDACRDNPMAAVTRSATKGLGRMDAPTGTMIAFATAPNTTASDNGDYAKVLAREMQKPGQELVDVFRKSEDVPPVADQAIAIGAKTLWLQLSIHHPEAEQKAAAAGLNVVSNKCTKIEHARRGIVRDV